MSAIIWMLCLGALLCPPLSAQQRGLRVQGKEQELAGFYDHTWAVIIGIDDYPNLPYQQQLQQAVRDAQGVEQVLREQFRVDRIITLYNREATRDSILKVFQGELNQTGENDGVFVFFAGHGHTVATPEGELGYLLPYDGSFDEKELYRNISMTTLKNDVAQAVPAKHIFFVMDACYSGLLLAERGPGDHAPEADRLEYLREITRERMRLVLAAGGKGQTVLDGGRNGHSVFTGRFLQALEEADGYITAKEIGYTVPEKVFYDAQDRGHRQQPQFGRLSGQGDFVFVRKDALVDTLPPTFGHLQVNVNAPNAKVYVREEYRGDASPGSPLNLENVAQGEVSVRVEASGYERATQRYALEENQWTQARFDLVEIPSPPRQQIEVTPVPPQQRWQFRSAYYELAGGGLLVTGSSRFLHLTLLQLGYYEKAGPVGINISLAEGIFHHHDGQDDAKVIPEINLDSEGIKEYDNIIQVLPLGVFVPVVRDDLFILSAFARAALVNVVNRAEGASGEGSGGYFPPLFRVGLEWRSFLHSAWVGFIYQAGKYDKGDTWPAGLDLSGVGAEIHVGLGSAHK